MYFTDKELFREAWNFFADNWWDQNKVTPYNEFALLYCGPRADMFFLEHLLKGYYDDRMSDEAKKFFLDNIDSPFMKELYPSFSHIVVNKDKFEKVKKEADNLRTFLKNVHKFKHNKT